MKTNLQNKLFNEFPLLYTDRSKSMRHTCMCWGVDTGDGWFDLIYNLSSKLEPLIENWILENKKDLTCVWCGETKENHNSTCDNFEISYPRASQVKEKYGTLCFYMTFATNEMWDLIEEAEKKSEFICETCGKPGKIRGYSWVKTLCERCDELSLKEHIHEKATTI